MSTQSRLNEDRLPTVDVIAAHGRPVGVLLLDVREPSEWATGHAPGAHHLPLARLEPEALQGSAAIYVICRSGNRSARATDTLRKAGLDAHNVTGGMIAWAEALLPIEHG
jgi:rhodanese-related sulfurtransferase